MTNGAKLNNDYAWEKTVNDKCIITNRVVKINN